jgi:hypothetical protein
MGQHRMGDAPVRQHRADQEVKTPTAAPGRGIHPVPHPAQRSMLALPGHYAAADGSSGGAELQPCNEFPCCLCRAAGARRWRQASVYLSRGIACELTCSPVTARTVG